MHKKVHLMFKLMVAPGLHLKLHVLVPLLVRKSAKHHSMKGEIEGSLYVGLEGELEVFF